uniref:EF-hand domain-containing protein n=1 Tax=Biomphalaria glabrata TaxID=6526 RepID=A0A2C9KLN7_BIOGL
MTNLTHCLPGISYVFRFCNAHFMISLFQYDPYRRGEIAIEDFMFLLRHPQIRAELDPHTLTVLEIKAADPQRSSVSYQEFVNMMTYRRNDSFRLAVESRDTDHWKRPLYLSDPTYVTCFQKMVSVLTLCLSKVKTNKMPPPPSLVNTKHQTLTKSLTVDLKFTGSLCVLSRTLSTTSAAGNLYAPHRPMRGPDQ